MDKRYRAVLHGNLLEWKNGKPDATDGVDVEVTVRGSRLELSHAERGRRMADALRSLAAIGAFADIDDPVEWQREIRRDRPLPGRDG